jgi:hypothetical protein
MCTCARPFVTFSLRSSHEKMEAFFSIVVPLDRAMEGPNSPDRVHRTRGKKLQDELPPLE